MKKLFIMFVMTLACSVQADTDCADNSYGLTLNSLVVAYDWAEKSFAERTGHQIMDEYFFNELVDPSCERIEVGAGSEVRCISVEGKVTPVGIVQERLAHQPEWDYFRVQWNSNVVIKSSFVENIGCIYGIAIK